MKLMKTIVLLGLMFFAASASAAVIDATNKWSWGESIGWMDWITTNGTAVDVTDTAITGEIWSEHYGWINLNPTNAGVTNTCLGNVGGHAWGESIGYIDMSGVSIDPATGIFSGTATTDTLGDIQFGGTNFELETAWRCDVDTDGDGFPDSVEIAAGSDPAVATSVPADTDGDGFPDIYETTASPVTDETDTSEFPMAPDPLATDTDGDGYPDWLEIAAGSDPALATSVPTDTDGDLVPDLVELMQGTDPALPLDYMDDDGDLVPNYIEAQDGTDATDPTVGGFVDTDGDLVPDYVEETRQVNAGGAATDSTLDTDLVDTDLGGVPDYVEETLFPNSGLAATDPLVLADDSQDTDAGGETDYDELLAGTDPLVKDGSEVPTSGGGGGTYIPRVCKDTTALNYKSYGISTPSKCEYAVVTATTTDTTTTVDNSGSLFDQLKALLVQVLAAKTAGTTVDVTSATCSLAITPTADIYLGSGADSQDIKLLQKYLNAFEGENLIADGTLRPADIAAVHRYQSKYPAEILTPWGLTSSTGRTFKTTVAHINSRLCNPETPLATAAPFFRVNMCNVYGSAVNLPHEVRLVQEFLNKVEGTTLRTDGVYDLATRDAIVAYQTKYNVVDPLAHAPGDMHDVTTAHMNAKIQEWIDAGKW